MSLKFHIFPIMIFAIVVLFGIKSYDFAQGLEKNQATNDIAVQLNAISSAAGQEAEDPATTPDDEDFSEPIEQDLTGVPYTGEEIQLLQRLAERREELDQRERDMDVREKLLNATENDIDAKIETLKNIETQIRELVEAHDEQERLQIESLVQTYSAMKPKDAAGIFNSLDMDILISIIEKMTPRKAAEILANMNTSSANQITVELATRKKLPNIEG